MLSVLIDRDLQEREDMNAIAGGQTINSHLMDENNSSKFPFRDPNHGPQAASAQRPPRLRAGGPPSQLHAPTPGPTRHPGRGQPPTPGDRALTGAPPIPP